MRRLPLPFPAGPVLLGWGLCAALLVGCSPYKRRMVGTQMAGALLVEKHALRDPSVLALDGTSPGTVGGRAPATAAPASGLSVAPSAPGAPLPTPAPGDPLPDPASGLASVGRPAPPDTPADALPPPPPPGPLPDPTSPEGRVALADPPAPAVGPGPAASGSEAGPTVPEGVESPPVARAGDGGGDPAAGPSPLPPPALPDAPAPADVPVGDRLPGVAYPDTAPSAGPPVVAPAAPEFPGLPEAPRSPTAPPGVVGASAPTSPPLPVPADPEALPTGSRISIAELARRAAASGAAPPAAPDPMPAPEGPGDPDALPPPAPVPAEPTPTAPPFSGGLEPLAGPLALPPRVPTEPPSVVAAPPRAPVTPPGAPRVEGSAAGDAPQRPAPRDLPDLPDLPDAPDPAAGPVVAAPPAPPGPASSPDGSPTPASPGPREGPGYVFSSPGTSREDLVAAHVKALRANPDDPARACWPAELTKTVPAATALQKGTRPALVLFYDDRARASRLAAADLWPVLLDVESKVDVVLVDLTPGSPRALSEDETRLVRRYYLGYVPTTVVLGSDRVPRLLKSERVDPALVRAAALEAK